MSKWRTMEYAPRDRSIMLIMRSGLIYCGRLRYGQLGEPSQEEFAWRCDSSGRFANPTHWMDLPEPPTDFPHDTTGARP